MPAKKRIVQVSTSTAPSGDAAGPFSVLIVCTGNICRSPAAQLLLSDSLGEPSPALEVSSAGTSASVGASIDPAMRALLRMGDSADRFTSRPLTRALVSQADLVLGMTREHRSAAVQLHPPALRYSFTLTEFARTLRHGLSADSDQRWHELPAGIADRLRHAIPLALVDRVRMNSRLSGEDEIADPFGRSPETFAVVYSEIHRAVRDISDFAVR